MFDRALLGQATLLQDWASGRKNARWLEGCDVGGRAGLGSMNTSVCGCGLAESCDPVVPRTVPGTSSQTGLAFTL